MGNDRELIKEIISKENLKVSNKTLILLSVKADVNDGDYIRNTCIVEVEDYYKVAELFDKVNGDWRNRGKLLSEDEIDFLYDYIPHMDNEEVHTIEDYSFEIYLDGVLYG